MEPFTRKSLIESINKMEELKQSTRVAYFKVIGSMMKSMGLTDITQAMPVIIENLEKRVTNKTLVRATARFYKAAILYAIADLAGRRIDLNDSIDDLLQYQYRVTTLNTNKLPKRSDKTSSKRAKRFPDTIINSLMELGSKSKKYKKLREAVFFIKANIEIGLRPIEWVDVSFFNYLDSEYIKANATPNQKNISSLAININNAKFGHGRSFSPHRELILSGLDEDKLSWITSFISLLNKELEGKEGLARIDAAKNYFKSLQKALLNGLTKLQITENRPSIYSTRHQCVSNAKKRGLNPEQIAAIFGHSSIETAKIHYGKKSFGTSGFTIIPSKETLNCVYEAKRQKQGVEVTPNTESKRAVQMLLNKI